MCSQFLEKLSNDYSLRYTVMPKLIRPILMLTFGVPEWGSSRENPYCTPKKKNILQYSWDVLREKSQKPRISRGNHVYYSHLDAPLILSNWGRLHPSTAVTTQTRNIQECAITNQLLPYCLDGARMNWCRYYAPSYAVSLPIVHSTILNRRKDDKRLCFHPLVALSVLTSPLSVMRRLSGVKPKSDIQL